MKDIMVASKNSDYEESFYKHLHEGFYMDISFQIIRDLIGGSEVKASACNVGDPGSIPGSGRSLEKEM